MDTVADVDAAATDPIPRVPLSDFQRDAAEHIKRLKVTGDVAALTVDGRPEVVVLSVAAYQHLLDEAESAYSLDRVRQGLADVDAGRVQPAAVVFDELYARFGIKRP